MVKHASETDGRAVTLSLTEAAEEIRELYVHQFHEHLCGVLSGIDPQDAATTVATLQAMHRLMGADRGGEWTTQVADAWPAHVETLMAGDESRSHTATKQ